MSHLAMQMSSLESQYYIEFLKTCFAWMYTFKFIDVYFQGFKVYTSM
jgi:hypothetical protein